MAFNQSEAKKQSEAMTLIHYCMLFIIDVKQGMWYGMKKSWSECLHKCIWERFVVNIHLQQMAIDFYGEV